MGDFTFQVDLKGMIRLLSENLYSDDSVFLRELLQNAVDAIEARRIEEPDFADAQIEVCLRADGLLAFSDNGIGLTQEEIHSFLSVIGNSSKRGAATQHGFIGQFGIGLLSCFLVADEIEVLTRSARSEQAYRWLGRSDGAYSVEDAPEYVRRGTTIYLRLTPAMRQKYDADTIRASLADYGFLLPVPVLLETEEGRDRVNDALIPFRESCFTKAQLLEFGEQVFERAFLDAIPVQGEGLSGCIYLSASPVSSSTMQQHKIYLKNMFITEDGKELVPKWAFFVQCFLNADMLTPTASREGFYRDTKLAKARALIERSIIDYLLMLSEVDPQHLKSIIVLHNTAIKSLAAENDRVFKLLFPFLVFSTNAGDASGKQLLLAAKKSKVFYCDEVDAFRKMRPLLENSKTLLINAGYVYDATLIRRAVRANRSLHLQQLSDEMIGDILQPATSEEQEHFADLLQEANAALRRFGCCGQLRRFSPTELASLFAPGASGFFSGMDGAGEEDFFTADDFFGEDAADEPGNIIGNCLYLNTACPLLGRMEATGDPELTAMLVEVLYLQALMQGGHPLGIGEMKLLNQNLTRLIELGLPE